MVSLAALSTRDRRRYERRNGAHLEHHDGRALALAHDALTNHIYSLGATPQRVRHDARLPDECAHGAQLPDDGAHRRDPRRTRLARTLERGQPRRGRRRDGRGRREFEVLEALGGAESKEDQGDEVGQYQVEHAERDPGDPVNSLAAMSI